MESRLESEHCKNSEIQQKNLQLNFLIEENSKALKNAFDEHVLKLEQTTGFKYQKIKEYFSKFGDQFKTHLRLYDKKKKEVDSRLDGLEDFMRKIPSLFGQFEAKVSMIESDRREEVRYFQEQIRCLKEEMNIHSIVQNEFQGMFELQAIAQNDFKREFMGLDSLTRDMTNKLDLQVIFQRELENEMKILNETQADLFQGFKKQESDLESFSRLLQNLSSNYNIFKKVQEKETVIKSQLIDLLQDINFLKTKIQSDGEMEKSMRKEHMEEIYKAIDQKFEAIRMENEKKDPNASDNADR